MKEMGILILDFSPVYYEAIGEIKVYLKNQDIPIIRPTDALGNYPHEIFLYWIARELEQNHCLDSAALYQTDLRVEESIMEGLDHLLKEDITKLIKRQSISSLFFPDTVELKFLGAGMVAAIRSEF